MTIQLIGNFAADVIAQAKQKLEEKKFDEVFKIMLNLKQLGDVESLDKFQ